MFWELFNFIFWIEVLRSEITEYEYININSQNISLFELISAIIIAKKSSAA